MADQNLIDVREAGAEAARQGRERKAPYDGRTGQAQAWYAGYDGVKARASVATEESEPEEASVGAQVGASTDPDVQHLAALRNSHQMVLAQADATDANRENAQRRIEEIDEQLRKMGYAV